MILGDPAIASVAEMTSSIDVLVRRLVSGDRSAAREAFEQISRVFGNDQEALTDGYVDGLLARPDFWLVVAIVDDCVVGGLTAHTVAMTTSERSEIPRRRRDRTQRRRRPPTPTGSRGEQDGSLRPVIRSRPGAEVAIGAIEGSIMAAIMRVQVPTKPMTPKPIVPGMVPMWRACGRRVRVRR